jgi:ribosomal protein S18 acetylase RimI-like enzyme
MSGTSALLEPLPWETRNLGVESFAVSEAFLRNPDAGTLKACLADLQQTHGAAFVQARFTRLRAPRFGAQATSTKTAQILEASGFYFVEATLSPYVALSKYAALERFVADPASVLPERSKVADLDVVVTSELTPHFVAPIREIAGESFVDDRFHVDHQCDPETASRRYVLWVDDLLGDGAVRFHVLRFQHEAIAFMASKGDNLLLAGFARRHANRGLGEFFWLRVLQDLRRDGVNGVSTVISVNNTSALNLYARLGFTFREPRSTFHLWMR